MAQNHLITVYTLVVSTVLVCDALKIADVFKRSSAGSNLNTVNLASITEAECRRTALGTEYAGRRAVTVSGRLCQYWSSQYPHEHTRNDVNRFPNATYNERNYCRNPDNEPGSGPWCYTVDPDVRWETCGIPICPECTVTQLGTEYRGDRSHTVSGRTCQRWDSQYPHRHSRNDVSQFPNAIYNEENYCRNPDNEESGPWCYTTDPDKRWEYCGISRCTECRSTNLGTDYRGQRSVTISGLKCQRWDSQSPHRHSRNDVSQFPDAAYNEENYCRNPDHEDGVGPWCYTNDPNVRWESCGIPLCPRM